MKKRLLLGILFILVIIGLVVGLLVGDKMANQVINVKETELTTQITTLNLIKKELVIEGTRIENGKIKEFTYVYYIRRYIEDEDTKYYYFDYLDVQYDKETKEYTFD